MNVRPDVRRVFAVTRLDTLLDVDDEFFVLLRPSPGGVALMVSDAVAALFAASRSPSDVMGGGTSGPLLPGASRILTAALLPAATGKLAR